MSNKIYSKKTAAAADRYSMDKLFYPSLLLMSNASASMAYHIYQKSNVKKVLILAGTGNNGGDGVCIARMLHKMHIDTEVIVCGNAVNGSWEFLHQLSSYKKANGKVIAYKESMELPKADILVDGIFGIGLSRDIGGLYKDLILNVNSHLDKFSEILAVDIPSGLNADTGEIMGCSIKADMTFTFGCNKKGLVLDHAKEYIGTLKVVDIGIPQDVYDKIDQEI